MNTETRVLIVDDELPVRQMAARFFRAEGFGCDVAADGTEAQEALASGSYDVVLLDMCVPDVNGHQLAVQLIEQGNRPIIMVATGIQELRLARDLFARGVDDVAYKPCDYRLLAIKAKALVTRRKSPAAQTQGVRCPDAAALTDFANTVCDYVQVLACEFNQKTREEHLASSRAPA